MLIVLTAHKGIGDMADRYLLPGFYDPDLSTEDMVDRITEAGHYLAQVRDWIRSPAPRGTAPERPPWSMR